MAVPLALSAYVRSILLSVEHVLIPKRLRDRGESAKDAYAHYGILHGMAVPIVLYPMTPLSAFSGLLVPEFAEDMAAGRDRRMSSIASRALNLTLAYATVCAVFLYSFSEELGYLVYKSYDAGYYIAALAPVVPIMFLDHVTDSMLKGIGEHVFSMWVNISDSLLSVILVCLLIPRMGIMGYAVVIVIMEGYNFLLSFLRLGKKIRFSINLRLSLKVLVVSLIAVFLSDGLFRYGGSSSGALWVVLKMVFTLAIGTFLLSFASIFQNKQNAAPCKN
jgi:stage V sporulation protein B